MKKEIVAGILGLVSAVHAVQISVETVKDHYVKGEPITVRVIAESNDPAGELLEFPSSYQANVAPDNQPYENEVGLAILTSVFVPPNDTYVWEFTQPWILSEGSHVVRGKVVGHGSAVSAPFTVGSYALPQDIVDVNFRTLPGTDLPLAGLDSYDELGIHFFSESSKPWYEVSMGNGFLVASPATYPPGFNIQAELDFPVYAVEADASSAAGVEVTMIAKNAAGEIVASASALIPSYGDYKRITLNSAEAIHKLEWWPSNDRASVRIANLTLDRQVPVIKAVDAGPDQILYEDVFTGLPSIALSAKTTGDIVDFAWKKDGQIIGKTKELVVDNLEVGVHVFVARTKDADGNVERDEIVITVFADPSTEVPNNLLVEPGKTVTAEADGYATVEVRSIGTGWPQEFTWTLDGQVVGNTETLVIDLPVGTHDFEVSCLFENGNFLTRGVTVTVEAGFYNEDPVFTSNPIKLKRARKGKAYKASIAGKATDIDGDTLTFSMVSGPAWLEIRSNGAAKGTPARSDKGLNTWTVRVNDGKGGSDTAQLQIKVK